MSDRYRLDVLTREGWNIVATDNDYNRLNKRRRQMFGTGSNKYTRIIDTVEKKRVK